MTRLQVHDRYMNDPVFRSLVDMMEVFLTEHSEVTPSELREAVILAATNIEMRTLRQPLIR